MSTDYWGSDAELINRLTAYGESGESAWEPVRDEFVHNVQLDVVMQQGRTPEQLSAGNPAGARATGFLRISPSTAAESGMCPSCSRALKSG